MADLLDVARPLDSIADSLHSIAESLKDLASLVNNIDERAVAVLETK